MPESTVAMMAGPNPHSREVSATAPKKKKNGSRCPAMGIKLAVSAANTKNSAKPYRNAGCSRYKSTPANRWRSPCICDHSSAIGARWRGEEKPYHGWLRLIDFAAHQPFAVGLLCSMAAQYAVQIECRTDQRKMREGLRKITERLTLWTCLFCVKPEMLCITQHSFKHEPGLVELFRISLTCACQCFHEPEGAHVKCAFFPGKSVNAGLRRGNVEQGLHDQGAPSVGVPDFCAAAVHLPGVSCDE